jgi:hypothetical protein
MIRILLYGLTASQFSNTISCVPSDIPNTAQNLNGSNNGNLQAELHWDVPTDFQYFFK